MAETFQKDYWEREGLSRRRTPWHPVVKAYAQPKVKALGRYMDLRPETTVLDVGCGNGFMTWWLEQVCDVTGVDYSEKMLEMNPIKKKLVMDAAELQFPDRSFDVVMCHALLHHVEDMFKVLSEMKRVSRKYVVVIEPNRNNPLMFLFSALVPEERKALKFSLGYLKKVVSGGGLEIIAAFSTGMIVPNKMPAFILPLMSLFNFNQPLGMTNFVIAEKK